MRRVECEAAGDGSPILLDADKIVYCRRYRTNDGDPRLEIYFSTCALCVKEMAHTMAELMPREVSP